MDSKQPSDLTAADLLAPRRPLSPQEHLRIRGQMVKEQHRLRDELAEVQGRLRRTDVDENADITRPLMDRRHELGEAIGILEMRIEAHDTSFRRQDRSAAKRAPQPVDGYTHGFVPDLDVAAHPAPEATTTSQYGREWPRPGGTDEPVGEPRGFDPKRDS